jgi:putative endonuclease
MRDPDKRYYVYVMGSLSGTLYIGVTNSIQRRCRDHRFGDGSEFTSKYKVDRLLYYEVFRYVNNAITREKQLKGWRRSRKIALIESQNPSWRDLSKDFERLYRPDPSLR